VKLHTAEKGLHEVVVRSWGSQREGSTCNGVVLGLQPLTHCHEPPVQPQSVAPWPLG